LEKIICEYSLLDPKMDFIFKLIFGNEKHPEILISFLNAVIKPINKIVSVKIDNTELEKKITFIMSIGFKFIY
jgi:predicted transposase/invertase (TIGR01784 family)